MRKIILAVCAGFFVTAMQASAMQDDDLGEQFVSTDTLRPADEDEDQVVIQEADSDLIAFVRDYIAKDIQLKGAFLIEAGAGEKILRLKLLSLEEKCKDAPDGVKTAAAVFTGPAGEKWTVVFYLRSSSFGGTELSKIELIRKPAAGAAPKK